MKTILWDFDGVILDSMTVRDWGFEEIFKSFDKEKVKELLDYHRFNGGLSRYVKIRYFFEKILKRQISDEEILEYASRFSEIMLKELINPKNIIQETLEFIKNNYKKYNFHIVSGSDGKELNFLCEKLNISDYFISIQGSPTPKNTLVEVLLKENNYDLKETCLIGDSINDYEAASKNKILFFGFNNRSLLNLEPSYIESFNNFQF
ncbi:MAG: HAD superfamily hydrolase (TIGR01549 family) [Flavobacteriaceae bacterium]|jgi:HAD superfamily hydrolase (TIGR01549 family)